MAYKTDFASHPCTKCGACCARFRVQFHWREAEEGESDIQVPKGFFEQSATFHNCMKGTDLKRPKCAALQGKIGERAICAIYASRPSPCREFKASFSDGRHHPRCDEARAAHGLRPLKPDDWRF